LELTEPRNHGAGRVALRAEHLAYAYRPHSRRRRVGLVDASISLDRGVTGLIGPNGAGKTTLLKILSGDLISQAGTLTVDGPQTFALDTVGYLPQNPRLPSDFTCLEFVSYCAWLGKTPARLLAESAERALDLVHLGDVSRVATRSLSGGMQRRLALAGVLVNEPPVLLLDEPMSGLDPGQRHELRSLIHELGESAVIAYATHVMQDLPSLSAQVVMLNAGRTVFSGTPEEFCFGQSDLTADVLEAAFVRRLEG
jgi:ABC-2 type transport system ATP-binding protein